MRKCVSKTIAMLLTVALVFSLTAVGASAAGINPFRDVSPTDWYYSYVIRAYENNLMSGVGDNEFNPGGTLTREQCVAILARLSGSDLSFYENSAGTPAHDVKPGQWYTAYVAWGYAAGVTSGVSNTEFGIGQAVTREQMATMLQRYVEICQVSFLATPGAGGDFRDKALISAWAADAVEKMCAVGIFRGDTDGNFNPQKDTTRAEAATVLCNFIDAIAEEEPNIDPDIDTDGDGISDADEIFFGSDPYAFDDTAADTDLDGLTDYVETYITNTDIERADTDGDLLSDYEEVNLTGTDPLLEDTDNNGTDDYNDDEDRDGLRNGMEVSLGTDPRGSDTDGDKLSDGDENSRYRTDPLLPDTDGDGADDGWEVENEYDPLSYNSSFHVSAEGVDDSGSVAATVELECSGDPASLSVERTTACGLLDESTPGYICGAFDFSADADFGFATISFNFDPYSMGADADPTIYYLNEETQLLEPIETTVIGGVAYAQVSHFSTYVLLDRNTVDSVWETDILAPGEVSGSDSVLDIVFVIDYSASMNDNDPNYQRLTIVNEFIDKLRTDQDRASVVKFAAFATTLVPLSTDKQMLTNAVSGIQNAPSDGCDSEAGTNGTDGLHAALEQLKSSNGTYSYIIFLTDGEDTTSSYDYDSLIAEAQANGVTIFSIGMGDADVELLTWIASSTGGKYYFANAVDMEDTSDGSLMDAFSEIENATIDRELDSNGDGISDYYTRLLCEGKLRTGTGVALFAGVSYEAVQSGNDYDNDGLINGEEVIVKYDAAEDKTYIMVISSPVQEDTDGDGILDYEDTAPRAKGLAGGVIGELSIVSCYVGEEDEEKWYSGHAFLVYKSYVNDSLDFSALKGYEVDTTWLELPSKTLTLPGTSSYEISPGEYVSIGNFGKNALDFGESAIFSDADGIYYNFEFRRVFTNGYDYSPNAYITRHLTQNQWDSLISFCSGSLVNFWTNWHNCSTVACDAWNHVYGDNLSSRGVNGLVVFSTPSELKKSILSKDEGKTNYSILGIVYG